ncbi:ABC transporter permease [Parafilimonas terrae]|uniref:ABC-2 type transport system permease protein n=1 Tax=Parafilimonas terrae TaxID=1465490 RepID=A0A1I5YWL2_9BACT|nr:ABC transporter permease [Parafilimonas terrae]SFQ48520.1 ABC-2 type transport system permease protein [Parafilimonas terrae]
MKQFFSFIKKEFYHIWRDRRTMFILLGMPLAQIIIFGFALTNEVKNESIAILDQSKDAASSQIINKISASRYFNVTALLHNPDEIARTFQTNTARIVLVLPSTFGEDLRHVNKAQVQLVTDASDPNIATTLINYATAIITDYQQSLNSTAVIPYQINVQSRMLYNPQLKGAYSFVPGVMAMVLMLICTMMTAITIVREKETGTMEVMLVSPVQPMKIVMAKAIPYLLLTVVNITNILLLSVFVLDVPINGSLILLTGESILFTITCLSFGLLISSVTDSQQTAMMISMMGLFLPTVMLSGFMFPIENMPLALRIVSNVVPSRWYYEIVVAVMIKGLGISSILKQTLVLSGMTVLLLSLAIKNFKIRLE